MRRGFQTFALVFPSNHLSSVERSQEVVAKRRGIPATKQSNLLSKPWMRIVIPFQIQISNGRMFLNLRTHVSQLRFQECGQTSLCPNSLYALPKAWSSFFIPFHVLIGPLIGSMPLSCAILCSNISLATYKSSSGN